MRRAIAVSAGAAGVAAGATRLRSLAWGANIPAIIPEVVLLDLKLAKINGLEVLR